jgi:HK97 family phage portal protein
MAVVRSFGALQRGGTLAGVSPPTQLRTATATVLGCVSYAAIYRHQPEVRVVIEFLARNIAQLGLHLHELVSETDRRRDRAHGSIRVLERPNFYTTRYRLIEQTVQDLAIFGHAFWIKVRRAGGAVVGLVPVPPERMSVAGDLFPVSYRYEIGGRTRDLDPTEVVHFRHYDPIDGLRGVSPLEALKGIVAESRAAAATRIAFWKNGAKLGGVIQRPKEAGTWTVEARDRFRRQFDEKFTGTGNAGRFPVLEEGMTFAPVVSTMVDAESVATWKLSREEAARAYHIPLPMVGILDHATFSNIKEQHRHLYQDCLGPWLEMLSQELELQFLPDFDGFETRYLEFNIAQKLAGSFEEQASALQTLVGRPLMSVNEGRARLNLSSKPGEDAIAAPLNMNVDVRRKADAVAEGVPAA